MRPFGVLEIQTRVGVGGKQGKCLTLLYSPSSWTVQPGNGSLTMDCKGPSLSPRTPTCGDTEDDGELLSLHSGISPGRNLSAGWGARDQSRVDHVSQVPFLLGYLSGPSVLFWCRIVGVDRSCASLGVAEKPGKTRLHVEVCSRHCRCGRAWACGFPVPWFLFVPSQW